MEMYSPLINRNKNAYGIIIHPNGSPGITIRDESSYGRTVTAGGGGDIINSGRFGKSLRCRHATSDYYSISYSAAAHNLGAGDFTMGFWVNFYDIGYITYFISQWGGASDFIYFAKDSSAQNNKLCFRAQIGGVDKANYLSGNLTFNNAQNYYLECVRIGSAFGIFIDGTSIGLNIITGTGANDIGIAGNWEINLYRNDTRFGDFAMSELFLMKGRALHTSNFTPPTRRI